MQHEIGRAEFVETAGDKRAYYAAPPDSGPFPPSQPKGNGETSAPKPGPFDVVAPAPGMVETRN